jgi:predicted lipid-binding transport protein (Tim44 family)
MKRIPILLFAAFAALTLALNDLADAARLGGGRSFGAQRQSVAPSKPAPPAAAPTAPTAAPASNANAAAQPATPASPGAPAAAKPATASAAAPSGPSRWLGPIAGIAAGLGLAALLSRFGLPEGLGSVLLIGLGIFAVIFLVRMFLSRRATANPPLRYAGADVGAGAGASLGSSDRGAAAYEAKPEPAWRNAATTESVLTPAADAPGFGVTRRPLPQGFDAEGFVSEAKRQFIRLQGSYDTADRAALSAVMTSEMYTEIGRELAERGPHHATEVVTLDADVLEVSTEGDKHWASVRFTGLVREDGEPLPKSIDEVWNLAKPVRGTSGWLLAGITQLA